MSDRPSLILSLLQNPKSRLLVVVAHPDDEVIGLGGRLGELHSTLFVHVTTGATADQPPGYEQVRREELQNALTLAGLRVEQSCPLGFADQQVTFLLPRVTGILRQLIANCRPQAILTHPYEGGHPDHDAIAFAVSAACRSVANPPLVIEMASYHQGPNGIRTGEFLPNAQSLAVTADLTEPEKALKRRLLACFPSQRETLQYFGIDRERFRIAPAYDFSRAPHPGQLFYEQFHWGISTGEQWRRIAAGAWQQIQPQPIAA